MKFDFCKDCLTDEERAVLALRKRGWRNAEIAAELHCSEPNGEPQGAEVERQGNMTPGGGSARLALPPLFLLAQN